MLEGVPNKALLRPDETEALPLRPGRLGAAALRAEPLHDGAGGPRRGEQPRAVRGDRRRHRVPAKEGSELANF